MRIPITMCHGISESGDYPLTESHLGNLAGIAKEMGFNSIDYDQLHAWWDDKGELPDRPIMFDFDHPMMSMREGIHATLSRHGYAGNLFINTGMMEPESTCYNDQTMTWKEVRELAELGWHIGAHTVTHPNLSELFAKDPTGETLAEELVECDAVIEGELGIQARDFAFTGTSWSSAAEKQVMARYRFGRLWIIGTEYQADGEKIRYADLVGVEGPDEDDGGPPNAARYITRDAHPYRLPSMEIQRSLIHSPEAFRRYLEGALEP